VSGERELRGRGEDAQLAALRVLHEDGLRETEVRRHALAVFLRHLVAVEEHAQRVAAGAALADEDLKDVELGHGDLLVRSRPFSVSET
jgi:hypothetical protein